MKSILTAAALVLIAISFPVIVIPLMEHTEKSWDRYLDKVMP